MAQTEPETGDRPLPGPAETLATLATELGFRVMETISEPARDEIRAPMPERYATGAAGRFVQAKLGPGVEPWRHQAKALAALDAGESVVVTTPTASGKSLVFQAHGIDVAERGGCVVVLYPIKALSSDQMRSWRRAVADAGLPPEWVGEINGDVPVPLRADILSSARIVCMTPDVMHAWLMGSLDNREVRSFLARTNLVVLDEAHVLDAAFGSNAAMLMRRFQVATDICRIKRRVDAPPVTYLASSATMLDPVAHLAALTGRTLTHVSEEDDGSPRHGRKVMHVVTRAEGQASVSELQRRLAEDGRHPFITFADSRKAVELLAMAGGAGIMPYRNGYELKDRQRIESGLRDGGLKGVVATSALEMGIDMGRLSAGLNLGTRATRRSIRQRIGRVGRSAEGAFAVIAEEGALSTFGESFADYVAGPVEPSHLYLDNPYLQYQHARCLHHEFAALGVRTGSALPRGVEWPEGFARVFAAARPDRMPPSDFADVHRLDTGKPHLAYSLRSVGEGGFTIETAYGKRIGTISRSNALQEAYPDGTYLHMGRRWTVAGWKPGRFGPKIIVRPGASAITKPILRSYVNGSLGEQGVVEGRVRGSGAAFAAECRLMVKETVLGFTRTGVEPPRVLYGKSMGAKAKNRFVRTTGVVLRIPFLGGRPVERMQVANAIIERHRRAYGIAPGDVGAASESVTMRDGPRMAVLNDAMAFYDTTQGSLRLSRNLLEDLPDIVAGLVASAGDTDLQPPVLRGLAKWLDRLDGNVGPLFEVPSEFEGVPVHGAGTEAVRRREGREDLPIRIVEPLLIMRKGEFRLSYLYKAGAEGGVVEDGEIAFAGAEPERVAWDVDAGYLEATATVRP